MATAGQYLKEGYLNKRQRGWTHENMTNLRFQRRYIRISETYLEYLDGKKARQAKGRFPMERIRIVEKVDYETFRKQYCFQVGDEVEVMYFAAKTETECDEWLQAFRNAASRNSMLERYHKGAFGLIHKNRWSCCASPVRAAMGCEQRTKKSKLERAQTFRQPYSGNTSPFLRRSNTHTFLADPHQGAGGSLSLPWHRNIRSELSAAYQPQSCHPFIYTPLDLDGVKETSHEDEDMDDCTSNTEASSGFYSTPSGLVSRRSSVITNLSVDAILHNQPGADSVAGSVPQKTTEKYQAQTHGSYVRKKKQRTDQIFARMRDSVELLEEEDSDVGPPNSPLYNPFVNDDYQEFKQALEDGANPDDHYILHLACERGCTEFVELLLKHKANVNLRDDSRDLPLNIATRKGHQEIVQLLLKEGAQVDEEGADDRTPLHNAADAGHKAITELLVNKGASVSRRDKNNDTPYDIAYERGHKEVMNILKQALPEPFRPYTLLGFDILHKLEVTALTFRGLTDTLVSGSKDRHVFVWDTSKTGPGGKEEIVVSNTVLAVDSWRHYLAIGSTSVQVIDMNDTTRKWTISEEDEKAKSPPLHFVAFEPQGTLATASVEDNLVKLWSLPLSDWTSEPQLTNTLSVGSDPGCISSVVISPSMEQSYLAVGIQPGKQFKPIGSMRVHLFNLKAMTQDFCCDTGDYGGHGASISMAFSQDGQHLAFGYHNTIRILETKSRQIQWNFRTNGDIALTCLSYSPSGVHISAGMTTGEVQVFSVGSGICEFTLECPESPCKVTALSYSNLGERFAVGHSDGTVRLWEAYTSCIPPNLLEKADSFTANLILTRQGILPVTKDGAYYHSTADDFTLSIPEGALTGNCTSAVYHGVVRYGPAGPFEFPDGWRAVSPIVYCCFSREVQLSKPVSVTLPHCSDSDNLRFLKASHTACRLENGRKIYRFEPIDTEEEMTFNPDTSHGTVHTYHFCYWCIGKHSKTVLDSTRLCLVIARPLAYNDEGKGDVFLYLMYDLETCRNLLKIQLDWKYDLTDKKLLRFTLKGADASLDVKVEDNIPGGWEVKPPYPPKLYTSFVDIYDYKSVGQLATDCDMCTYPPRVQLPVVCRCATVDHLLQVNITGTSTNLTVEVPLVAPQTAKAKPTPLFIKPRGNLEMSVSSPSAADVATFRSRLSSLADNIPPEQLPLIGLKLFSSGVLEVNTAETVAAEELRSVQSRTAVLLLSVFKSVDANPALLDTVYSTLATANVTIQSASGNMRATSTAVPVVRRETNPTAGASISASVGNEDTKSTLVVLKSSTPPDLDAPNGGTTMNEALTQRDSLEASPLKHFHSGYPTPQESNPMSGNCSFVSLNPAEEVPLQSQQAQGGDKSPTPCRTLKFD